MASIENPKVKVNLAVKFLPEEIRHRATGSLTFNSNNENDRWIWFNIIVDGTDDSAGMNGVFRADGTNYLNARTFTTQTDIDVDTIKFIWIKHTGYSDLYKLNKTTNGVMVNFADDSANAGHTTTFTENFSWLDPEDTVALKLPLTKLDEVRARVATGGMLSPVNGDANTTVLLEVIAIATDGG